MTATTAYAYDQSVTGGVANAVTSAKGVTTTTVFDNSGRKLRDVVTDPEDATKSMTTAYTYDAHGQVTSVTREDGSVVRYAYDAVGNVVSEQYFASASAQAPEIAISYTYSNGGSRLESAVQTTGSGESAKAVTTAYSYDQYGRVTQQRQETDADAGALAVNYRYNGAGQVTAISYAKESAQGSLNPGNTELHILWYTYDADGRLSAIYLDAGSASTTSPTSNKKLIRSYAYNAYGDIETVTDNTSFLTGGTLTTELAYTYNDFGLPVKLTYTDVDGKTRTVREETNLTYDGNGNILTEAVTEAYTGSTTKTRTYQYDLGNRLISATYDGTTTAYTYDAVGNRLTRQQGTETAETYTYNYLNQLTRVQQGTAVTTYTYDARGNQTQQVQTGTGVTTTTNYGYDLANRLISTSISNNAVNPLSTGATYAYNAQGQRVTRVEDEVVTHFYYTGSALLFTTVNEYVLQTQNILDPSGTIVASKRFEGQAETEQDPYADDYFFYRYDVRGSVTTIVDGEGAVVKSYDYDEFGVTTSTGDTFFNEVTFTGSVADASGLLYMNARYYNPSTARFLSQDSYTGSASDPWTQHLYAYCNNNPVNMVDPTGHMPKGLMPPVRMPMVSVFDKKQSKGIIETAAKTLSSKEVAQEDNENPNDYNISMFNFGKADPVLLEEGQMYYVEGSVSGFSGSLGMAILFDREKYCIYRYQGIGFGKGLTVDAIQSKGIVSNVYEVADYCGHFINGSSTLMGLGKAQSIWWKEDGSPVVANTIANSGWGSLGISYQYYGAFSEDWIYGEAPIDWMMKQGQTLWNNAGPRIGTDDWRVNLYFGD